MEINPKKASNLLIDKINQLKLKHQIHEFASGAKMIDVWLGDELCVIQIDGNIFGISVIDKNNSGFDTTPDITFSNIDDFIRKIDSLFNYRPVKRPA
jgi:hypothetical protein